jgi:hypothetical protein
MQSNLPDSGTEVNGDYYPFMNFHKWAFTAKLCNYLKTTKSQGGSWDSEIHQDTSFDRGKRNDFADKSLPQLQFKKLF